MTILKTLGWEDYELLDSGDGKRFERFGLYKIVRPDPQVIWNSSLSEQEWKNADAVFTRTEEDKGFWKFKKQIPEKWKMTYKDLSFNVKLTNFKHTGIFPEQSLNWDWIKEKIENANRPISVLNLFAYTGIATLAAASAGAKLTHVDASKPSITWAKENQILSNLQTKPIRWIFDDCVKFVEREIRRGNKYDGIIMDPPVYGHGPTGQIWKFSEDFPKLLQNCVKLLSDNPLFILVNAYAISSSSIMLENVLNDYLGRLGGEIESGELCLEEISSKRLLSTGMFARWTGQ